MFGKKKKNQRKFVAQCNPVEQQEIRNLLQQLKALQQNQIGTTAVLEAAIRGVAQRAGIRDLNRVQFDLERMTFYELPVQTPQPPESQPQQG